MTNETSLPVRTETLDGNVARPEKFLLSVVIPCFNEEDVILLTYRRLVDVLGSRDFRLQIIAKCRLGADDFLSVFDIECHQGETLCLRQLMAVGGTCTGAAAPSAETT